MKVLIISMTCGEGHNQIAKAIKSALDNRNESCEIVQLYGFNEKQIKKQNDLFLNACKYIPHLYEFVWNIQRKRNPSKKEKGYMELVIRDCKAYIGKKIEDYSPDAIVCTHNNAGAVVGALKREGRLDSHIKTYGIVFDYCLCPYWESNTDLDYVIVPHENMTAELISKGFKKEQVLPYGLVVNEKFTLPLDKFKAREELGVSKDLFTVALYSGGNCASPNFPLVKELLKVDFPIQIIAICGKNKKQYDLIEKYVQKYELKNVYNIGFCGELEKVFASSDVVFSRGGGMGLTEQINKHVPFVFREKLIINEKINAKMFEEMGMGIRMKKLSEASKIASMFYNKKDILDSMSKKQAKFCKPNATRDFVDRIIKA